MTTNTLRVLVTVPLTVPEFGGDVDVVQRAPGDWIDVDGLLIGPTDSLGADDIDRMPSLRAVAVAGSGVDAVDVAELSARGILLLSAPDPTVSSTAELAVCLMLMVSRGIRPSIEQLARQEWTGWAFDQVAGRNLAGLRLGLVGFGRIGREVQRLVEPFGMQVQHHCRTPTGVPGYRAHLVELLADSDVVSIHLPLTDSTRLLIGRPEIAAMPTGSVLINTSRGGVLDEQALTKALIAGRLSGAGLDVFQSEPNPPVGLMAVPNLVVTPHIGTATAAARTAMVEDAAGQLLRALAAPRAE